MARDERFWTRRNRRGQEVFWNPIYGLYIGSSGNLVNSAYNENSVRVTHEGILTEAIESLERKGLIQRI